MHNQHPGRRSDGCVCQAIERCNQAETVSAWIRDQRLWRTRRDLADAALDTVPIHEIATRWGFGRVGDFSRAFRTAYGESPREFRSRTARRG
ncbi:helix-turn-helix domain-containing protein [Nonomuraea sp. CA-141351]|uniref:helix-turn-helix domain-containing protein n=1 Tax=Nonomuraea sp. CA-141351 TaxID=3239996 RepID=UPI003D8AD7EE